MALLHIFTATHGIHQNNPFKHLTILGSDLQKQQWLARDNLTVSARKDFNVAGAFPWFLSADIEFPLTSAHVCSSLMPLFKQHPSFRYWRIYSEVPYDVDDIYF